MNKPPAFQFYPKDWDDYRVKRMSYEAQGVYMRLLCFMWKDSGDWCSIQNDDIFISNALGLTKIKWLKIKEIIQYSKDPILIEKNGKLISKRLRKEAQKIKDFRKKQSKKGKESARKRRKTANSRGTVVQPSLNQTPNRSSTGHPTGAQPDTQPEPNSSSSSSSSNKNKDTNVSSCLKKISDVDIRLTDLLMKRILDNNPKAKIKKMTNIAKERWINDCRLLREADKWSEKEIETVILYTQQDEFEKTVVLSMPKLRKRFDSLLLKASREWDRRSELRVGGNYERRL